MELSGQAERGNGGAERLSQYEGDSGDNGGGDCECAVGHGSHWRDALRGVGAWCAKSAGRRKPDPAWNCGN